LTLGEEASGEIAATGITAYLLNGLPEYPERMVAHEKRPHEQGRQTGRRPGTVDQVERIVL
jgi:hypothetical protein